MHHFISNAVEELGEFFQNHPYTTPAINRLLVLGYYNSSFPAWKGELEKEIDSVKKQPPEMRAERLQGETLEAWTNGFLQFNLKDYFQFEAVELEPLWDILKAGNGHCLPRLKKHISSLGQVSGYLKPFLEEHHFLKTLEEIDGRGKLGELLETLCELRYPGIKDNFWPFLQQYYRVLMLGRFLFVVKKIPADESFAILGQMLLGGTCESLFDDIKKGFEKNIEEENPDYNNLPSGEQWKLLCEEACQKANFKKGPSSFLNISKLPETEKAKQVLAYLKSFTGRAGKNIREIGNGFDILEKHGSQGIFQVFLPNFLKISFRLLFSFGEEVVFKELFDDLFQFSKERKRILEVIGKIFDSGSEEVRGREIFGSQIKIGIDWYKRFNWAHVHNRFRVIKEFVLINDSEETFEGVTLSICSNNGTFEPWEKLIEKLESNVEEPIKIELIPDSERIRKIKEKEQTQLLNFRRYFFPFLEAPGFMPVFANNSVLPRFST